MIVNVENLQAVLKKATLNFTIESCQLKITEDRIVSKMRTPENTVVIVLDQPNDVISDVVDEIEMNFAEPNQRVTPYLNLLDDAEAQIHSISDEKLVLKQGRQKTNLFFCAEDFVTTFTGDQAQIDSFYDMLIDVDALAMLTKIRKAAAKFQKVYVSVKDGTLFFEATDKQNRYSNGVKFEIDTVSADDLVMTFPFKTFNSMMMIVGKDIDQFTCKMTWLEEAEAGMLLFEKNDGTESYALMSKMDED